MKYLRVTLPQNIADLHEANFVKLDKEIKSDLDRWDSLPLDTGSRIETIKNEYCSLTSLPVSIITH